MFFPTQGSLVNGKSLAILFMLVMTPISGVLFQTTMQTLSSSPAADNAKLASAQQNLYDARILTQKYTDRNHSIRVAFCTFRWDFLRLVESSNPRIKLMTEEGYLLAEKKPRKLTDGIYYAKFPALDSFGRYKVKGTARVDGKNVSDVMYFRVDYYFNIQDKMRDWSNELWSFLNASVRSDDIFGNVSDIMGDLGGRISDLAQTISSYFRYSIKPPKEPWVFYIVNLLQTAETNDTETAVGKAISTLNAQTNTVKIYDGSDYFDYINSSNLNESCFVIYTANITAAQSNYTEWFQNHTIRSMIGKGAKFFISGQPFRYVHFTNGTTSDVGYELWHKFQKDALVSPVTQYNYTELNGIRLRRTKTLSWILDYMGIDLAFPRIDTCYSIPSALVSKTIMTSTNTRKPVVAEIHTPGGGQLVHYADQSDATANASLGVGPNVWATFTQNLLGGINDIIGNFFSSNSIDDALSSFYSNVKDSLSSLDWSGIRNQITGNFVDIFRHIKRVFSNAFGLGLQSNVANLLFQSDSESFDDIDSGTDNDITGQLKQECNKMKKQILYDGVSSVKERFANFSVDLSNVVREAENGNWGAADDIESRLNSTFRDIQSMFSDIGSYIKENTMYQSVEADSDTYKKIQDDANQVNKEVKDTVSDISSKISGLSTSSASEASELTVVVEGEDGSIHTMGIWSWVKDKFNTLKNKIQNLRDDMNAALDDLESSLKEYARQLVDNVQDSIDQISNVINNLKQNIDWLKKKITKVKNWAKKSISDLADKLWDAIDNLKSWVTDKFKDFKGWVKDGLDYLKGKLQDLAGYIDDKLLDPLRSVAQDIMNGTKQIAQDFFDGLKHAFKWFYRKAIKPVAQQIYSFLETAGQKIVDGLNWVVQKMVGFMRGMVMQMVRRYTEPLSSLIERTVDTIKAVTSRVTDVFNMIKANIQEFINQTRRLPQLLKGLSEGIAKFLAQRFKTFYDYMKSFRGDISKLETGMSEATTFVSDKANKFLSVVRHGVKEVNDLVYSLDARGRVPETFKRIGDTLAAVSHSKTAKDQYGLFHFRTQDRIYILSVLKDLHNPSNIQVTLRTYSNDTYRLSVTRIATGLFRADIPSGVHAGTDAVVEIKVSGSPDLTTGFSFTQKELKPISGDFAGTLSVGPTSCSRASKTQ